MTNRAQAVAAIAKRLRRGRRPGRAAGGAGGGGVPPRRRAGDVGAAHAARRPRARPAAVDAGARAGVVRRRVGRLGADGRLRSPPAPAAAYLGDEAVAELFGQDRLPVIAGQGTRPGTATPVRRRIPPHGILELRVRASSTRRTSTRSASCPTPARRASSCCRSAQATLIDNWDVLGLRATGSIDYRIDDVFVPEAFTHLATTESPRRGGRLYSLGIIGLAILCHSGWAAGIGRRVLDELARQGAGRRRPHRHAGGQRGVPRAVRQGRGQVPRGPGASCARRGATSAPSLDAGTPLTVRQHTLIRLALANITWSCHEVSRVRLHRGRHGGAALRHDAAPVPRHARRHAARHVGAAGHPQRRPRAGRRGRRQEVAVPRPGRPGVTERTAAGRGAHRHSASSSRSWRR